MWSEADARYPAPAPSAYFLEMETLTELAASMTPFRTGIASANATTQDLNAEGFVGPDSYVANTLAC